MLDSNLFGFVGLLALILIVYLIVKRRLDDVARAAGAPAAAVDRIDDTVTRAVRPLQLQIARLEERLAGLTRDSSAQGRRSEDRQI